MTIVKVQIRAEAKEPDHGERFTRLIPADEAPQPPTLANLRKRFGNSLDEVELEDKFGMLQQFSLAPFVDMAPDTYINISFLSGPAEREFPPLEPGAVLLKEYLVAEDPDATR
jgi:hypothetical protein